jgi:hypothetical protein
MIDSHCAAKIALAGWFWFIATPVIWSQESEAAAETTHTNDRDAQPSGWMEEITEVRRQLGAGLLNGSLLDDPNVPNEGARNQEFLRELRRIAAQAPRIAPDDERRAISDATTADICVSDVALNAALRHAARLLEEKANRLEDSQSFGSADQCRKLATRLRRQSHKLSQ